MLHAEHPAAVCAGNTETSQRVVDVVFAALRQAAPGVFPAESAGSMSSLALGGDGWTYYETSPGGSGGHVNCVGASAVQTHMTNTLNTPAEALELQYPLRVVRHEVAEQFGGLGNKRGGDGVVRELLFLEAAEGALLADRRRHAPGNATAGRDRIIRTGGNAEPIAGKATLRLEPGDRLVVQTPGGSGA